MSASEQPWVDTEGHALNDDPKAKSSSVDNLLLLLAVLFFVGLCVTLVGIVPVLIMIVGAVQAFRSGDVKNMKVSARFVQILVIVGMLICFFIAMNKQSELDETATRERADHANHIDRLYFSDFYYAEKQREIGMILALAGGIGSVALIVQFLWIDPFTRQLPVW